MTLSPIWVIATNNYREIIRDKLLYGIFAIALLVTGSSFFLATISLDQNARVLQNIGLASIHIFTAFICIFVTCNSLAHDFERRTLYLLLPKPLSKAQYILGKFLGIIFLILTTLALLGGLFFIGSFFIERSILPAIGINLAYSFLEVSLLSAIALLFSTFTAPLNASLYTISLFFIGHSLTALRDYASRAGNIVLENVITASYYLLPNLEKFDVRQAVLYGLPIMAPQVISSLIYWALYTSIVLSLAIFVMKKREV